MRQPDIISIEEGDIFAFGIGNPQISGSAHAPVLMTRMLQITYPIRISLSAANGDIATLIR
jgi:hypothetical protein